MQIGEFLGIHHSRFIIRLPGTEIPKRLKLNHESDGNVISFWVGRKFPNIFFVCLAFGPLMKYPWTSCYVYLSINGCKKERLFSTNKDELSDHLWIVSFSSERLQNQLNKSNPSKRNFVEVICEAEYFAERLDTTTSLRQWVVVDWIKNNPRGWGVRVECICQWFYNNGGGSRHQCEEETVDQPMPDVPKNTNYPTLDGFESDSDFGNGALVQPEFQHQRSCLGTFFFFIIHSLCLENQRKGNKQVLYVFCFFFFWETQGPLTEMEEIDPKAFNNGEEDSGLSITHTYVNDGSHSMLYPPSKKARKS